MAISMGSSSRSGSSSIKMKHLGKSAISGFSVMAIRKASSTKETFIPLIASDDAIRYFSPPKPINNSLDFSMNPYS